MTARGLRALVAVFTLCLAPLADARYAWFADGADVTRVDTLTGERSRWSAPGPIDALAPDAGGSVWMNVAGRLARLDHRMSAAVEVTVPWAAPQHPAVLAADIPSGGAWWGQGTTIGRMDPSGDVIGRWTVDEPIESIVVGGPGAVWVLTRSAITQYSDEGTLIRRQLRAAVPVADESGQLLLDRGGMYLWLRAGEEAVQLDLLAAYTVRARIALPPAARQVAVEPVTGVLWVLTPERLHAFDRSGAALTPVPIPSWLVAPTHLTPADPASWAWIAGLTGVVAVHVGTLDWLPLSTRGPVGALALAPRSLAPLLTASVPLATPAGPMVELHVQCDGEPCEADPRYTGAVTLRATAGDREVPLTAIAGRVPTFAVEPSRTSHEDGSTLVEAVDAFGVAAAPLVLGQRAADDAAHAGPKALPTVAIAAPANNAVFVAPATIAIAANAADSDGTVTKVEFFRDGVLLGTDTSAPYSYSWSGVAVGTYKLTAKAYDNAGGSTLSAIVTIQVKANVSPTVTLTSPANNSAFTAPATIALAANAADADGTVAKVEFFQGSTRLATDTSAPYGYSWTNVAGGTYTVTAKATDDKGAVTTSTAITVKVNKPPTVSLTAPVANATFGAPASIAIKANAADSDGTVAKVQFYRNGVLLGTDTTSPYAYSWTGVPVGSYALTAVATDNLGATTTSTTVNVTVAANQPPTISITAPASGGASMVGTPVVIAATAADPDGGVVRVEFYRDANATDLLGTDSSAPYSITSMLPAGTWALTAVAVDSVGARTISVPVPYTVLQDQPPTIVLTSPTPGQVFHAASPPDILLAADVADPENSIAEVRFYMNGNPPEESPTMLGSAVAPPYRFLWQQVLHNDDPGNPFPWGYDLYAEVTDNAGNTTQSDVVSIVVRSAAPRTVRILSPSQGPLGAPRIASPATVVIAAVADNPPGALPVVRVEFLANGSAVGSMPAPNGAAGEFALVWRGPAAGTFDLVARAHDAGGGFVDSMPTTVMIVPANAGPTVALTAPGNAQAIDALSGIGQLALAAAASDPDGSVAKVEFHRNGQYVGQSLAAPFAATINAPYPGRQMLVAKAVDNRNASTESRPVFVEVPGGVRAPKVVVTSPVPGTIVPAGSPVTLGVDVASYDGTVAKVDYYDGGTLIATRTAAPFTHTATLATGPHTVTAIASVALGGWTRSSPVSFTVSAQGTAPPTVELQAPEEDKVYLAAGTVPLVVAVSDPSRQLQQVQYYAGSTLVATSATPPFAAAWTNAPAGVHWLSARGVYGASQIAQAQSVRIEVRASEFAELRTPAANAYVAYGERIALEGQAGLAKGVAAIEFQVDGAVLGAVSLPSSGKSGRAVLHWDNAAAGAHSVRVRAIAPDGSSLASVATPITVGVAGVSLVEPIDRQVYVAPGAVRIAALPALSSGAVAQVDFYGDGQWLASRTTEPYVHVWRGAAAGSHFVQARVRDTAGRTYISRVVPVTVVTAPALTVDAGIDGSTVADTATITGRVAAPPNAAVVVNGRAAIVEPDGSFSADGVPMTAGSNSVTVVLNTLDGTAITRVLQITGQGVRPFAVHVDPVEGFAPLTAHLTIRRLTGQAFGRIDVDLEDDGTPDVTMTSLQGDEARIDLNYPSPGTYTVRVTVYDASNRTVFQTTRRVRAMDPSEVAYRVVDVYRTMTDRLAANDPTGALRLFAGSSQERYGEVFTTLAGTLPQVVAQLGDLVDGVISETWAELTIARPMPTGAQAFMIYLVRGEDGLWRIESM